jgi:hypothetical protein
MLFRYAESCLKVNNARSRSRNSPPFTDRHFRDFGTRKVEFTCDLRIWQLQTRHAFIRYIQLFAYSGERYKIWYTHILMHLSVLTHAITPIVFLSLQRLTLAKVL